MPVGISIGKVAENSRTMGKALVLPEKTEKILLLWIETWARRGGVQTVQCTGETVDRRVRLVKEPDEISLPDQPGQCFQQKFGTNARKIFAREKMGAFFFSFCVVVLENLYNKNTLFFPLNFFVLEKRRLQTHNISPPTIEFVGRKPNGSRSCALVCRSTVLVVALLSIN